jgi:uncharacterized damage-inducible protein DinB
MALDLKAHCAEMLAFHHWRQQRIGSLLGGIDKTYFEKQLNGSFSSLLVVLSHLVWAEKVWLGRVDSRELASMNAEMDAATLLSEWASGTAKWQRAIAEFPADQFDKPIRYYTTQGEAFENSLFEIVTHLVDHSTYHIGQMMNAVRSFGLEPVSTNYIHYLRAKDKH